MYYGQTIYSYAMNMNISKCKTRNNVASGRSIDDIGHFAWCALIALRLAQQEGRASTVTTEHTFLLQWISDAYRQKRFPRSVVADIEHLLQLARQTGVRANLAGRLEYLIQACSDPEIRECELFRLVYVLEALRNMGWNCAVVNTHQWKLSALKKKYRNKNVFLSNEEQNEKYFSPEGKLVEKLEFFVGAGAETALAELRKHRLDFTFSTDEVNGTLITVNPTHSVLDKW